MGRAAPSALLPMNIATLVAAAAAEAPGRPLLGLRQVRSLRWVPAEIPAGAEVEATEVEPGRLDVVADGYARARVLLGAGPEGHDAAPGWPVPGPAGGPADGGALPGPAPVEIHTCGPGGLDATVRAGDGPAFLEAAVGALACWVEAADEAAVGVPARIDAVDLTGPAPGPGDALGCVVRVTGAEGPETRGTVELVAGGEVRARLRGVVVRRLTVPGPVRTALRTPERTALAERREGYTVMRGPWPSSAVRDLVMRLYLDPVEWARYATLRPNAQQGWSLGRVAVKDAVRRQLWDQGAGPLHPRWVRVANDGDGRPWATGPDGERRAVSVAHRHAVAVAAVGAGVEPGIDVEVVEPRAEAFVRVSMTDAELALRRTGPVDEWVTRLWTVKEAVAKAAGTGLQGRPRAFVVEEVDGDWARIGARWVHTTREDEFVVSTVRAR